MVAITNTHSYSPSDVSELVYCACLATMHSICDALNPKVSTLNQKPLNLRQDFVGKQVEGLINLQLPEP